MERLIYRRKKKINFKSNQLVPKLTQSHVFFFHHETASFTSLGEDEKLISMLVLREKEPGGLLRCPTLVKESSPCGEVCCHGQEEDSCLSSHVLHRESCLHGLVNYNLNIFEYSCLYCLVSHIYVTWGVSCLHCLVSTASSWSGESCLSSLNKESFLPWLFKLVYPHFVGESYLHYLEIHVFSVLSKDPHYVIGHVCYLVVS